jgi:hypothetical protein
VPGAARVVQAYFPGGSVPAKLGVAQRAGAFSGATVRAPHPATVAQPQAALDRRPPHAAKLGPRAAQPFLAASSSAPLRAAQPSASSQAFQTPANFLSGASARQAQALPLQVQKKMESFFGADFSEVRVHVGPEASSIGALAFTLGTDLYFAPGQYEPHTPRGQELIGHELTHVVQQREGRVANPFGDGVAVVQDPELEAEADRMGKAAAASSSAQPKLAKASQGKLPFGDAPVQTCHPARVSQMRAAIAAQPRSGGYELTIGTYLHEQEGSRSLPEDLAGHSFVALREPGGASQAFGFSPADFGSYDVQKDLGRLKSGVRGVVHADDGAFEKPGVKVRSYPISRAQAQAAMAKVEEYESGKYSFSLQGRQCSAFALDVLRAAEVQDLPGAGVRKPREMYRQM